MSSGGEPANTPAWWTTLLAEQMGASNAGCWRCGAVSEVLTRILSLQGYDAKMVKGQVNGVDHVWVQIGEVIYDPTVEQFANPVFYTPSSEPEWCTKCGCGNDRRGYAHLASCPTLDDDGPCTDCSDTGITHQTERACSCDAGDQYRAQPGEPAIAEGEYMSVTIDRAGNVTSHNAFDANFDEMVEATGKIIAALQQHLDNHMKCPFAAGRALRSTPSAPATEAGEEA